MTTTYSSSSYSPVCPPLLLGRFMPPPDLEGSRMLPGPLDGSRMLPGPLDGSRMPPSEGGDLDRGRPLLPPTPLG
eukprot:CAMPEP_0178981844 /NCGR_PEP_ID=MMETSP0795-20121207/167_1 /TAXON_ID=88552 /ORGANISM="Amoebophrya sp., Strain Ameob2" /LENGTH=74 /DNA_ID=CAMNT_0020672425 /DNA_START=349 /DNA_END=570 /DNA_ORIENTATION=+